MEQKIKCHVFRKKKNTRKQIQSLYSFFHFRKLFNIMTVIVCKSTKFTKRVSVKTNHKRNTPAIFCFYFQTFQTRVTNEQPEIETNGVHLNAKH